MPVMFIFVVGIGVALLRRRLLVAPEERASEDAPARLLGWAVGLLAAQRDEWGQAMIGELDRLDGRARRWRFALGSLGAAMVLPPWGPTAAALGALMAVAASAGGRPSTHRSTTGWGPTAGPWSRRQSWCCSWSATSWPAACCCAAPGWPVPGWSAACCSRRPG